MTIRIGAHKARGDLGAPDRRCPNAEVSAQGSDIETGEMEDLQTRWIGQQRLQVWSIGAPVRELDQMTVSISGRKLRQTESIPKQSQALRLSVHRDSGTEIEIRRQIAVMEVNGHRDAFSSRLRTGSQAERRNQERPTIDADARRRPTAQGKKGLDRL